jgi:hypothetical protein
LQPAGNIYIGLRETPSFFEEISSNRVGSSFYSLKNNRIDPVYIENCEKKHATAPHGLVENNQKKSEHTAAA